jgi:hypothetical protein
MIGSMIWRGQATDSGTSSRQRHHAGGRRRWSEFAGLYSPIGRPSIPPEKLLRAKLLQAFYSHRGGIRLDQDGRRAREDQLPWP